ncbi:MAG: hypothetical protein ABSC25_27110, partial [Roseiarcus sp.]
MTGGDQAFLQVQDFRLLEPVGCVQSQGVGNVESDPVLSSTLRIFCWGGSDGSPEDCGVGDDAQGFVERDDRTPEGA